MKESGYDTVVLFSGGGTRFALYCGMCAALEDTGRKSDLIIGSCGGAVAATIIGSFATNSDRRKYLESEELYEFIRTTRLTEERWLSKIGVLCAKKILDMRRAPFIENIFDRYLVDMPEDVSPLLPSLSSEFAGNARVAIVGAKVLFDRSETGERRHPDRKLYRKVVFTDSDTAGGIDREGVGPPSAIYDKSAVDPEFEVMTNVPMYTAMRISLSDMFYVPPVRHGGNYFAGGAIDLVPLELAKASGRRVIVERKRGYSAVEEALVRAVLGYSGNARLRDVEAQGADLWIDTRDSSLSLRGHYCRKSIDLRRMQVAMSSPGSHGQYVKDVEAMWNYGYGCVTKASLR